MRRVILASLGVLSMAMFPCASPPPPTGPLPSLNRQRFVQQLEPHLLASCAFSNCHGEVTRPFRLFSPAGERKGPSRDPSALEADEHEANYLSTVAAANRTSSELPDLLRKPLQLEAGGAGHGGVDRFGRNVYASKSDVHWQQLNDWVSGTGEWDAGVDPGTGGGMGGTGGGTGGGGITNCQTMPFNYAQVSAIVNTKTCSEASCHTAQNVLDAGCFLADSCITVREGGCGTRRSVVPCNPRQSRLWRYTGADGITKPHQGKLTVADGPIFDAWIKAGAPCGDPDAGFP